MISPKKPIGATQCRRNPAMVSLLSALEINQDLHRIENQCLLFVVGFLLRRISREDMKRHLREELPANDLEALYTNAFNCARRARIRSLIAIFHPYGLLATSYEYTWKESRGFRVGTRSRRSATPWKNELGERTVNSCEVNSDC
jgi:hypothetical protein